MISGRTRLIVHIGYPTETFKAPMIYNPYFEAAGIDAVVVPMASEAADFPGLLRALFTLRNLAGALITMPHKGTVLALLDEISTAARIAGACNAVKRRADGALIGDMFDGEGFARAVARNGRAITGAAILVVGAGGVGSAIAAALAARRPGRLALFDTRAAQAEALAGRLAAHYPALALTTGSNDPSGFEIVVNATPLGMKPGDPLPMDVSRIAPETYVGEVVMKAQMTPLLEAAAARGCAIQPGIDMLFEQMPAYLEFFGFPTTTPDVLRRLATIHY